MSSYSFVVSATGLDLESQLGGQSGMSFNASVDEVSRQEAKLAIHSWRQNVAIATSGHSGKPHRSMLEDTAVDRDMESIYVIQQHIQTRLNNVGKPYTTTLWRLFGLHEDFEASARVAKEIAAELGNADDATLRIFSVAMAREGLQGLAGVRSRAVLCRTVVDALEEEQGERVECDIKFWAVEIFNMIQKAYDANIAQRNISQAAFIGALFDVGILTSEDLVWCMESLRKGLSRAENVYATYALLHQAAQRFSTSNRADYLWTLFYTIDDVRRTFGAWSCKADEELYNVLGNISDMLIYWIRRAGLF